MPKLWHQTVEAHRRGVRDAILHTAAALVAEHGLHAVTMSQIAEETGIGRATLYKYFPDVEAILVAWHDRQVTGHIERLAGVRDRAGGAAERLEAVLEAYALMTHERPHGTDLAALVHRGAHFAQAQRHLSHFIRGRKDQRRPGRRRARRARGLLPPRPRGRQQPAVRDGGPPARHGHPGRAAPPGSGVSHPAGCTTCDPFGGQPPPAPRPRILP